MYEKKREQVILAPLVFGVWFVYAKWRARPGKIEQMLGFCIA